ncbi:MAG: NAD-dependent epimerase/dehydratase family protein [Clostridiales bacterium]|nr:NAD-dependent epimerase/dehydratase family protein [Clostridiales bacterium]
MQKNNGKKVLVLGGTGAMGVYLVPQLAQMGYDVHVVSLDKKESTSPNISYFQADAKDCDTLRAILRNNYDAIVDFMLYSTIQFLDRYRILLSNTNHYIYLSSYRVFAGSDTPINEESAQLLDISDNKRFLATDDYSLAKARQEDILENSSFLNWTIVRPAITYSKLRYQLVTLEANTVVARALKKRPVVLPREALSVQGTMTWAGDVAKMLSRLVLNPAACRQAYIVSTSEHRTWEEIAGYYRDIIGLEYIATDMETYLKILGSDDMESPKAYQLRYDRCFNRIIDNSKILRITGLSQSELMPLRDGLAKELAALPENTLWSGDGGVGERMDAFLQTLRS